MNWPNNLGKTKMNPHEAFNRNLRYCLDFRDLTSAEFAFRMHVHMDAHCQSWSRSIVASQRKTRRIIARFTEPRLCDMSAFAYLLRVPPWLLVFGTIEELKAAMEGEK